MLLHTAYQKILNARYSEDTLVLCIYRAERDCISTAPQQVLDLCTKLEYVDSRMVHKDQKVTLLDKVPVHRMHVLPHAAYLSYPVMENPPLGSPPYLWLQRTLWSVYSCMLCILPSTGLPVAGHHFIGSHRPYLVPRSATLCSPHAVHALHCSIRLSLIVRPTAGSGSKLSGATVIRTPFNVLPFPPSPGRSIHPGYAIQPLGSSRTCEVVRSIRSRFRTPSVVDALARALGLPVLSFYRWRAHVCKGPSRRPFHCIPLSCTSVHCDPQQPMG